MIMPESICITLDYLDFRMTFFKCVLSSRTYIYIYNVWKEINVVVADRGLGDPKAIVNCSRFGHRE